jgi:uncharacterized protein
MIDTSVELFPWPFRRVPGDQPADLVARLRNKRVTQAWVGSNEALLMRDVSAVNMRLADACREHGPKFLVPFGTVNPKQPDWQEDLRRCHEVYHMPGIRLYPNYHGYTLDDPLLTDLFTLAAKRNLMVQIAASMEDPRVQFPLMMVHSVNPSPLGGLSKQFPNLRFLLLSRGNWGGGITSNTPNGTAQMTREVAQAENIWFDIATVECVGGVKRFMTSTSPTRVVFGSHYPFFYFDSALFKVWEAELPAEQAHAVLEGNAHKLLKG